MAKNKLIRVNALVFHRAMMVLRKAEKRSATLTMGRKPLSNMLNEASDYSRSKSSIPVAVKIAILSTSGISNPDPSKLKEEKEMADFKFNDLQYLRLTRKFNTIAATHSAGAVTLPVSDVADCTTVQDCIDLVTAAAS